MDLKPASNIDPATAEDLGLTEEQVRQRKIGRAIRAKRAKERGLAKATGTDDGSSSPDLHARLEASSTRARDEAAKRFKAKQAVAARLRQKTQEER